MRCQLLDNQAQAWSRLRSRTVGTYGALWWRMVYAAQPGYRYAREGSGPAPLPIEAQAEEAAVQCMVAAGVLNSEVR